MHVFADMDLLEEQQAIHAYGPVEGEENDKFQTTSRLRIDEDVTAYAVTDGVIIVQETASPAPSNSSVNVILKPFKSPDLRFPAIKYFIYRGIDRDTILSGTGANTQIKEYVSGDSDLINYVWQHYNDLNEEDGFVPNDGGSPTLDILGYINWPGSHLIEKAFMDDLAESSLFPVLEGWSIGKFRYDEDNPPGIEIVLEDAKQFHSFDFARKLCNVVEVTHDPNDSEGNESIGKMNLREQVTDTVDPAAFFHHYWELGLRYRETGAVVPQLDGKIISGREIFDYVTNSFYTRNTIWIDIRNHTGYSLNYFKENDVEGTHFWIGLGESPEPSNYYTNYWPIYKIDRTGTYSTEFVECNLCFYTENNPVPLLYADSAVTISSQPGTVNSYHRFMKPDVADGITSSLTILLRGLDESGTWQSLATISKLWYLRDKVPDENPLLTRIPNNSTIDNVLGPFLDESSYPLLPSEGATWYLGLRKKYVKVGNGGAMVRTGVGFSSTYVMFFAIPFDFNIDPKTFERRTQFIHKYSSESFLMSSFSKRDDILSAMEEMGRYYEGKFKLVEFIWQNEDRRVVRLDPVTVTWENYGYLKNLRGVMGGLLMTRDEYQRALDGIESAVTNSELEPDYHDLLISLDGYQREGRYATYLLRISGLDPSGNYASISPSGGNLFLLTIDQRTFTSEEITLQPETFWNLQLWNDPPSIFPVQESGEMNDLVDFVMEVERAYPNVGREYEYPFDHIRQTLTRIRGEYYGFVDNDSTNSAFQKSIIGPVYYYRVYGGRRRLLIAYRLYDQISSWTSGDGQLNATAYRRLKAKADENQYADNPSPYVIDPGNARLDFGHAIYGLEGLIWNNQTSKSFSRWHIDDNTIGSEEIYITANDLAGYIGDLGIALAEYQWHKNKGEPPGDEPQYPEDADIDRYYEISVPDEDVKGDVDGIGYFSAYGELGSLLQRAPEFSEVLKAYYELDQPSGYNTEVSYSHRYTLFALHEGMAVMNGANAEWDGDLDPDEPNVSSDKYRKIEIRLLNFALFWYNKINSWLAAAVAGETGRKLPDLGPIKGYIDFEEIEFDTADYRYIINRFLGFVKNGFDAE